MSTIAQLTLDDYDRMIQLEQCVEVYRQPQRGRFRTLQTFNKGKSINPLRFPDVVLQVETLFPPE